MRFVVVALVVASCSSGSSSLGRGSEPANAPEPLQPEASEKEQVAAIEKVVNDLAPAVYLCRDAAVADSLHLRGELVLEAELAAGGVVDKVKVVADTVGDAVLRGCLLSAWSQARFPDRFAVGTRLVLPPYEFHSLSSQNRVRGDLVAAIDARKRLLHPGNTGNASFSLSVHYPEPGRDHRFEPSEQPRLFYLRGSAKIVEGAKTELAAGSAVYLPPRNALVLRALGEKLSVVEFVALAGLEGPATQLMVLGPSQAEQLSVAGGAAVVELYFDHRRLGPGHAYLGVMSGADLSVPEHVHAGSTEVLLIEGGGGHMTVEGLEFQVGAGDAIQIPAGVRHSFRSGPGGFRALQFYNPSGPEQRFRGKIGAPR